jgi:hypothetical protein
VLLERIADVHLMTVTYILCVVRTLQPYRTVLYGNVYFLGGAIRAGLVCVYAPLLFLTKGALFRHTRACLSPPNAAEPPPAACSRGGGCAARPRRAGAAPAAVPFWLRFTYVTAVLIKKD